MKTLIALKGCPPDIRESLRSLQKAGIVVDEEFFSQIDLLPGFFMQRYLGKPSRFFLHCNWVAEL